MDETFGRQYQDEIMLGRLSACFTGIALFISGLGLFGLASFSAARRAKEIGIRKVMGATIAQMVGLLCSDYIKLVLVALGIALPISWWLGRQYLDDYAYKISLGIAPFLITSLSVLVVAMLTVSYQSLRAAGSNPVRVLKADN
jgi:putative ABC transport system permease protein